MCQFNISFSGEAESLTKRAKEEIEKAGGSLSGDAAMGKFEVKTLLGTVRGSYSVEGQQISFTIAKKPLLLPCRKIEKELTAVMLV